MQWVETYTPEDTLIGLKAVIHNLLIRKSSIQAKFSEVPVCMLSLIKTLLPLFQSSLSDKSTFFTMFLKKKKNSVLC